MNHDCICSTTRLFCHANQSSQNYNGDWMWSSYHKTADRRSDQTFGVPQTYNHKAHTCITQNRSITAITLRTVTSQAFLHDLLDPLPRPKPPQPYPQTPTLLPIPLSLFISFNLQTIPTESGHQLPHRTTTPLDLPALVLIGRRAPRHTQ